MANRLTPKGCFQKGAEIRGPCFPDGPVAALGITVALKGDRWRPLAVPDQYIDAVSAPDWSLSPKFPSYL